MKATLSFLTLLSAALAEIHVNVEQFSNLRARDVMAMEPGPHAGTEVTPNPAMLFRRQSGCPSGYFACPNGLWCAPNGGICCEDYGACYADEACCGVGCMPSGAECCSNGEYCPEGNICVLETSKLTGSQRMVCCTDLQCTAYIDDGVTLTRTDGEVATTTAAPTTTTDVFTGMLTYDVTVTWTYYFYFWTYIEYSLITSTLTTTRTTFTITATDDAAATASVEELEATLEFSPPAEQSSLSALADETTFGPTASPTDDSGSDGTTTSSTSDSTDTFVGVGSGGDSSAPGAWLDKVLMIVGLTAAFGAGALLL